MKRIAALLVLVFVTGCAAGTTSDASPQQSQPVTVSCVTYREVDVVCDALDPSNGTSYSCEDDVDPNDCVDDSDFDYGSGCTFTYLDTRWPIDTDCATYEADNPAMFKSK